MDKPMEYAQACIAAKAIFLRLLSSGRNVAFEEALKQVPTEGIDRRRFGWIASQLKRDRMIEPAGFRTSNIRSHNNGVKRLWRLAQNVNASAGTLAFDSKTNSSRKRSNVSF